MMILSDRQILEAIQNGSIHIDPFRRECLGSNSYDVHLGPTLGVYKDTVFLRGRGVPHANLPDRHLTGISLDAKEEMELLLFDIPDAGWTLEPGILYLGATEEYTVTRDLVPWLDGKSSVGRLGINIHATAGRGDAGFSNHWTLELYCIQPVRIYKNMPIGQLTYFMTGPINEAYNEKKTSVYAGVPRSRVPIPSAMWKNFNKETGKWR